jgi:hypothetical protein
MQCSVPEYRKSRPVTREGLIKAEKAITPPRMPQSEMDAAMDAALPAAVQCLTPQIQQHAVFT